MVKILGPATWVQIMILTLAVCVIFRKSPDFSVPWFPHPSTRIIGLWHGLKELIWVKCSHSGWHRGGTPSVYFSFLLVEWIDELALLIPGNAEKVSQKSRETAHLGQHSTLNHPLLLCSLSASIFPTRGLHWLGLLPVSGAASSIG